MKVALWRHVITAILLAILPKTVKTTHYSQMLQLWAGQIARDFQDIRRRGNGNAGPTESGRQYDQSNPSEQLPDCSTLIPVQLADGKGEIIEDLVDGGACVS